MISMSKPPHKFFERTINNDLIDLRNHLESIQDDLLSNPEKYGISREITSQLDKNKGAITQLGSYYNIFNKELFGHDGLRDIHHDLREAVKEACIYYGIDYESQNYYFNGWFNYDFGSQSGNNPSPLDHPENFHDHMGGEGAPVFHGYYCVNAEPSSTYYMIDGVTLFENVNKNNRLIVSETGHPHGIGNWDWEGPRITIAYDIAPTGDSSIGKNWIKL